MATKMVKEESDIFRITNYNIYAIATFDTNVAIGNNFTFV